MLLAYNMTTAYDGIMDEKTLDKTYLQYTTVRKAHVERVLDVGNRSGDTSRDMGIVSEYLMYGAMWILCKCLVETLTVVRGCLSIDRSDRQSIRQVVSQRNPQLRCCS